MIRFKHIEVTFEVTDESHQNLTNNWLSTDPASSVNVFSEYSWFAWCARHTCMNTIYKHGNPLSIFKFDITFSARLQLNELVSWRCSPRSPSTNELAGYTGHVGSCFSVLTPSKQKISNEFDNSSCWGWSVTTNH